MRILIADDNELVRRGIARVLEQDDTVTVCGEAGDSAEAMEKAAELQPDVVLLDVSMPGRNGLETTRLLRQTLPGVKILIVSQHDAKQMLPYSLEAGASGCLDKARLAMDLLPAIREIHTSR